MSEELKEEILAQILLDVRFGCETAEELLEELSDMFYAEDDLDTTWIERQIQVHMQAHKDASADWSHQTDTERLIMVFDDLALEKIICVHRAGYTRQDGADICNEQIAILKSKGIQADGYCFYHDQDLARAIEPATGNLMLGYESADGHTVNTTQVGIRIVEKLRQHGFPVQWNGSPDERILIPEFYWQKIPDDQDLTPGRSASLLLSTRLFLPAICIN